MATTYTVTNTFTADTTAIASEVNQNFTDVLTALNALDAGNLSSGTVPLARISGLTVTQLAAATLVTEAEGIGNNDNDTTWPTSAAVRDYVDNNVGSANYTPTSYSGGESITFPNGFIMKNGSESVAANTTDTVTFATAFPTSCVRVFLTANGTNIGLTGIGQTNTLTAASFKITNAPNSTIVYDWMAIGY